MLQTLLQRFVLLVAIVGTFFASGTFFTSGTALGGEPTYRVLNSPHRSSRFDVREKTPYAYGWFGSGNHTHWKQHYGYHQNYTQWSRQ